MNGDSFGFLSKYILQDLWCINDRLVLVGLCYTAKYAFLSLRAWSECVFTHFASRANPVDLIKLYGGKWAGRIRNNNFFNFIFNSLSISQFNYTINNLFLINSISVFYSHSPWDKKFFY